jgi:hypothetical protein
MQQQRWICRLIRSTDIYIHVPVKAIREQTDMSKPGKTYHHSRSHQGRRAAIGLG